MEGWAMNLAPAAATFGWFAAIPNICAILFSDIAPECRRSALKTKRGLAWMRIS